MMKLCGYRLTALVSDMSNAKYLAFGTPNTKNPLTLDVLKAKKFYMSEQSHSKFGTIWTQMLKIKTNFIPFFLPHTHFSSQTCLVRLSHLGCVCFGFKSLLEMIFCKCGCLLRMENKFSGNYFQLTGCFEGFDREMV